MRQGARYGIPCAFRDSSRYAQRITRNSVLPCTLILLWRPVDWHAGEGVRYEIPQRIRLHAHHRGNGMQHILLRGGEEPTDNRLAASGGRSAGHRGKVLHGRAQV